MWIRTQSNKLFNLDRVLFIDTMKNNIFANWDNADGYLPLATYATEQRALEVLDEIQECIDLGYVSVKVPNMRTQNRQVYVMPVE